MADWTCKDCGSAWAPGAPACPECRSTAHAEGQAPAEVPEAVTEAPEAVKDEPEPEAPAVPLSPRRLPPPPAE